MPSYHSYSTTQPHPSPLFPARPHFATTPSVVRLRPRGESRWFIECRRKAKRTIYHFHEISLFAENQAHGLGHGEIFTRFGIGSQARPVGLIRGETIECNQAPRHIVRALMRKEVPDKMAAASRDDATPIFGVPPELIPLEGIDLVADDTRNRHWSSPVSREGR